MLNWDEGNEGKGLIDHEGNVHTWNRDDYDTHQEYVDRHNISPPSAYFQIEPSGHISDYLEPLDPNALDLINDADPRLYHRHEADRWHFAWTHDQPTPLTWEL